MQGISETSQRVRDPAWVRIGGSVVDRLLEFSVPTEGSGSPRTRAACVWVKGREYVQTHSEQYK